MNWFMRPKIQKHDLKKNQPIIKICLHLATFG